MPVLMQLQQPGIEIRLDQLTCFLNSNGLPIYTYVSQGSVAIDIRRGGNFNSTLLHRSFLNFTVAKVIIKIKVDRFLNIPYV